MPSPHPPPRPSPHHEVQATPQILLNVLLQAVQPSCFPPPFIQTGSLSSAESGHPWAPLSQTTEPPTHQAGPWRRQWGAPGQVAPSEEQWLWADSSGVRGQRLSVSLSLAQPPWTLPGVCSGPTSALASAALCSLFSWRVSCVAAKAGHPPQVKGG